jgi:hypothetical protein
MDGEEPDPDLLLAIALSRSLLVLNPFLHAARRKKFMLTNLPQQEADLDSSLGPSAISMVEPGSQAFPSIENENPPPPNEIVVSKHTLHADFPPGHLQAKRISPIKPLSNL